jgi:hypothetical protein
LQEKAHQNQMQRKQEEEKEIEAKKQAARLQVRNSFLIFKKKSDLFSLLKMKSVIEIINFVQRGRKNHFFTSYYRSITYIKNGESISSGSYWLDG